MSVKIIQILSPLCLWAIGCALAADTNVQFRTLAQDVEEYLGGNRAMHTPPSEAYAVTPEAVDAGGRWSKPLEGFCLSLRFRTNAFVVGKPVLAYLYLRNATTNASLSYTLRINQGNHWSLGDIEIVDARNNHVAVRPLVKIMPKSSDRVLEPRQQQRFLVRLDRTFELEPGQYSIRARAMLPKMNGNGTVELATDWEKIAIVSE